MDVSDEEVWCECSDDEMYNPGKEQKGTWQPKPADILKLFDELKSKKVLELKWKCPGRRHPDSDKKQEEQKEEVLTTPAKTEESRPSVPNEFDFDDEPYDSKTVFIPRKTPGSAPKSEKKVARMNKVLKDMMQQRKQQQAEKEARKLANVRSPRTPGSPARARIGSPAGSPRTPPSSLNRQSPVRAPGPGDQIGTTSTPLRAPIESRLPQTPQDGDSNPAPTSVKTDTTYSRSPVPAMSSSQGLVNTQASIFSQSQNKEGEPKSKLYTPSTPVSNTGNKVENMDTST